MTLFRTLAVRRLARASAIALGGAALGALGSQMAERAPASAMIADGCLIWTATPDVGVQPQVMPRHAATLDSAATVTAGCNTAAAATVILKPGSRGEYGSDGAIDANIIVVTF